MKISHVVQVVIGKDDDNLYKKLVREARSRDMSVSAFVKLILVKFFE